MATSHLSSDEFFQQLEEAFAHRKTRDHGAIYLSQKRMTYGQVIPPPSVENPCPDLAPDHPLPILIRATNGKSGKKRHSKLKLSTLIQLNDLGAFYLRYAEVWKAGMPALKPRDKAKKKGKARARKKKTATNP